MRPDLITAVLLYRFFDNTPKILMAKRKSTFPGYYSAPGGKVEYGESILDCAVREVEEETGLIINPSQFSGVTFTSKQIELNHFTVVHFWYHLISGSPKQTEPDKKDPWEWFDLNNLPEKVFERDLIPHIGSTNITFSTGNLYEAKSHTNGSSIRY